MLYVPVQKIETVADLRAALGNAVRLELSTIPAYLYALYSIKPGTNETIANILRGIVIEEMLHMSLACNILNAVGGTPTINAPGFPPTYPGPLPMGIGDEPGKEFIVPLRKLSMEQVVSIFMTIEEPEEPLDFPVKADLAAALPDYHTIGEFYAAISETIEELGPPIFTGDPKLQVTGWFGADELFPIANVESAQKAIDIIVTQGEGTQTTPVDVEGEIAHYYLFEQIEKGRALVVDPSVPQGYSFSGEPVVIDTGGVWPVVDNPANVTLDPAVPAYDVALQFDATYGALLNALQATFTGHPEELDTAIGLMYSLRLQAQQLVQMPIAPGATENAGPRFLFDPKTAAG